MPIFIVVLYDNRMSKAFTKENDDEPDEPEAPEPLPKGTKNYMTPRGFAALQKELRDLMQGERPRVVEIVSWAAGNGDRSENGDYIYNKKRLREIDKRARYLTKRLESAEVIDPRRQQGLKQVFFGAHVTYALAGGPEVTVQLVGIDEANLDQGRINWASPMGQALLKTSVGDVKEIMVAGTRTELEIISIEYRVEA